MVWKDSVLTGQGAFEYVFQTNYRCNGSWLRILARSNGEAKGRLGLVVSRKISSKAVHRNYMKRVCRELYRSCQVHCAGIDLVVVVRSKFTTRDFLALSAEFAVLVKRIQKCHVWRDSSSAVINSS